MTATGPRDVVVIGGSAGAVEALFEVLARLPSDLPAAIAVVLHRHPTFASRLAALFSRRSTLEVVEPGDGDPFTPGRVYLAPQDRHMLLEDDQVVLTRTAKQHHTRPAIDPLFESAAQRYGHRVVGVLLTGNLSDGVSGLIRIKQAGGLSLAQEPGQARYPSMPRNALIYDNVDLVFELGALGQVLHELVRGQAVSAATSLAGARPAGPADAVVPDWLVPGRPLP